MFSRIMIPVDLAHKDSMAKAVAVAAKLASDENSSISMVGVTTTVPTTVAHSPEEYRERLEAYAAEQSAELKVPIKAVALKSNDPAVDLDKQLKKAAADLNVDLIVMGSHIPSFSDWITHSHARWLAAHTECSMLIVR